MAEKMRLGLTRSNDQQSNWGKLSHGSEAAESVAVALEGVATRDEEGVQHDACNPKVTLNLTGQNR